MLVSRGRMPPSYLRSYTSHPVVVPSLDGVRRRQAIARAAPKIQLVCVDIDGTLLNSRSELTNVTEAAVTACAEAGVPVSLLPFNSGRASKDQQACLVLTSLLPYPAGTSGNWESTRWRMDAKHHSTPSPTAAWSFHARFRMLLCLLGHARNQLSRMRCCAGLVIYGMQGVAAPPIYDRRLEPDLAAHIIQVGEQHGAPCLLACLPACLRCQQSSFQHRKLPSLSTSSLNLDLWHLCACL